MTKIPVRFFLPVVAFFLVILLGCSSEEDKPFTLLSADETGIYFSNEVENSPDFNILNYLYFYDGGGVAAGDINNDGLPDLFFTGNSVPNRLYLNKGNFEFEDITESAGITDQDDAWSTGVTMADVNGDANLDIYVSRSTSLVKQGANQLFINNGDGTFTEQAEEYGLNFEGYSTQAVFFDYNNNGRLDLFLLNHSFHSDNTYGRADELRSVIDPKAGDKLFRNDGDSFTDVTGEAGIISSSLGYGLGVAVSDINQDGLPDIYVGNDFHEDDYLYINNGDGTFSERMYEMIGHTSVSSMGNDVADIMNNAMPDIVSLDMMPPDHESFMRSGGPDLVIVADTKKDYGFGEKNSRNTLQVNQGPHPESGLPLFSETAFASGIARTEWSWAALFADFDNDGWNDLYVTNGIPGRPNELDFVNRLKRVRQQYSGDELQQQEFLLTENMTPAYVPNFLFKNKGNSSFEDKSDEWGFSQPSFSTGAVYVDLNNNGRLDLVVNNINEQPFIYRNEKPDEDTAGYLKVKLNGEGLNSTGIGSKIIVYKNNEVFYREQMPVRGFQSSVDHVVHFGLGDHQTVDSLLVVWPDSRYEVLENIGANQMVEVNQTDAAGMFDYSSLHQTNDDALLSDITSQADLDFVHRENSFDDFSREPLMPYKLSVRGPALATADINGDGLDDFYIGGSHGMAGSLFVQLENARFVEVSISDFDEDKASEDVDAVFFDATGNGLPDLYVVSGGNELSDDSRDLQDRLYINRGDNNFEKSPNSLPDIRVSGSVVTAADFDGDGSVDLFTGGHSVAWRYGIGPKSTLLKNNGRGMFEDVTEDIAPEIETIGNVTSAAWIQNSGQEKPDLIIAGEWMAPALFENNGDRFIKIEQDELAELHGLWQSVEVGDITGNGYPDIVLGNFGMNSRIQASPGEPLNLYINDFDGDGQTNPLITRSVDGREVPFEQLDELLTQIPDMTDRVQSYRDFATRTIDGIFEQDKLDNALQKKLHELRSVVLLNDGAGNFEVKPLPQPAQHFPVMGFHIVDVDEDGYADLLVAGNLFDVKPSVGGRQDAGYGLLLKGDGSGNFTPAGHAESGFLVMGQSRSVHSLAAQNGERIFIVARNNDSPLFFKRNN
ncbi:MAG: VCBS repeat-containing protein [Balneolaceae bacterium]